MAESDSPTNWPGPVTFNDDEPKKGFACIYLSVPKLEVKRKHGFIGKYEVKNATVERNFKHGSIEVSVKLSHNGKDVTFCYKKNAPDIIDPERSDILYKDNYVIVKLAKVKAESWARHSRYLVERPG